MSPSLKVGLTGNIGCGKSTVGLAMEAKGFKRIDTDTIVRELLEGDSLVIAKIADHFGPRVLNPEGTINRGLLADIVFKDVKARLWLESLLHPIVGHYWRGEVEKMPKHKWVIEIPLLFEKNLEKYFDWVVVIASTQEQQLLRLSAKGLNQEKALARMASQLPIEEKVAHADIVIENNGSLEFLNQQTERLVSQL